MGSEPPGYDELLRTTQADAAVDLADYSRRSGCGRRPARIAGDPLETKDADSTTRMPQAMILRICVNCQCDVLRARLRRGSRERP